MADTVIDKDALAAAEAAFDAWKMQDPIGKLEAAILAYQSAVLGKLRPAEEDGKALKACPFCGGAAERVDIEATFDDLTGHFQEENAGGSFIHCLRCEASTAIMFDRKENLIGAWNDRVSIFRISTLPPAEEVAEPLVDFITQRNWKNGGHLIVDRDEAINHIAAAIEADRKARGS